MVHFDFVVSSHCLEHIDQAPLLVLREWMRVLKVRGVMALLVPNGQDGIAAIGESPGTCVDGRHVHIFTPDTLRPLLEYAGATVEVMQVVEREEWKTTTLLAVARKQKHTQREIQPASIRAYLIWLKAVGQNVTAKGLAKWFLKGW